MKNSSNLFKSSDLYKNGTALIFAGALMSGCASTNNKVNDVMSVDPSLSTPPKVSTTGSYNLPDLGNLQSSSKSVNLNVTDNSGKLVINNSDNVSSLSLGVEDSSKLGIISAIEYRNIGETFGTLVTAKVGEKNKSFLLTGLYKGVDFSAKATVGHLVQEFEGKDIGQSYVGAEFLKEIVEGLRAGAYVNATRTDSRTLSVTEVTNQVVGGREILTTTERFVGGNSTSAGLSMEYDINERNTFSASLGNTNLNGNGTNYSLGYTHYGDLFKPSIEYTRTNTGNFSSEIIKGQVDYIIADNFTVGAGYEKINSTNLNDNRFMLTFKYVPGLKRYSNTNSFRQLDLTHVRGAEQAMTTLYGNKETTVVREFIADEIEINKDGLNAVIQTANGLTETNYTPSSWNNLQSVLNTSVIVRDNVNSTQLEVNTATTNLQTAIDNLVEALPAQNLDIVTSGPIISGANTDTVTALIGPGGSVDFTLNVNFPYTLSNTTLSFPENSPGIYTQTVNILYNGDVVGTRTLTVNWE